MNKFLRLAVSVFVLAAGNVQAAFHLWTMNELYSNADGSVQFLELTAITGGQQFMAGQMLSTTNGAGVMKTFIFPNNLPGDTSGRRMLIGTQGFAAAGVIVPDYVVPNGFFAQGGGSINFVDADVWNHPALPSGNLSLNRDGTTAVNSPRNFANATGTFTPGAGTPLNFQALWYNSPAESESGWGVNITHQGDIFFVTWFTYDTDGSQMWLVGPDVRKTTGNTYAGPLYRTSGPPFNSVPFGAISFVQAGTISFTFTSAEAGSMTYTVGTTTQTKQLTRQLWGVPPTCTAGGTPGATPNFSDLWYNSPAESEPGWGVNLMQQGDIIFLTWFTYDTTGRGMWVVGPRMERTAGSNTFTGQLFRTTGPAFSAVPWTPITAIPFGNATVTFTGTSSGTFAYTVTNVTPNIQQTKNITRQVYGSPATVCRNAS